MFYDLASSSWGAEEIAALHRVIDGGQLTIGQNVRQFEEDFARKFGVRHALMVSSGSAANLVGIAALFHKKDRPLQRGDEVIVPSISWATTYYPLQQYGLTRVIHINPIVFAQSTTYIIVGVAVIYFIALFSLPRYLPARVT